MIFFAAGCGRSGIKSCRCASNIETTAAVHLPSGNCHTSNRALARSEEHTSELQSLMRISYAVFCLKKKTTRIRSRRVRSIRQKNSQTTLTNSNQSSHLCITKKKTYVHSTEHTIT